MKKRAIAALLAATMVCSLLTACHNSSEDNAKTVDVEATDFDPEKAVEGF